ncbi:MAG: hypothetical protein LBH25_14610 [Fibromonadaceae bacterium]|nr:hypothetical protein [Fibromonadaceae bacterium]
MANIDDFEECTDEDWFECVLSVSAKIDVDCENISDSIKVKKYASKHSMHGVMRIFDKNKVYKDEIGFYAYGSNYLGMIQLPFGPINDSGYICSKKILNLFYYGRHTSNLLIKQNGLEQIKYIIKNSIKKIPSEWMNMEDLDTTFQAYCSVMSPLDFLELGISQSEWVKSYYPDDYSDSLFLRNTKGLLVCYYANNHLIKDPYKGLLTTKHKHIESILKIPISKDVVLYQTAHGVLLRKGSLYRWVYFSDMVERLRWPSINKVTVSNGQVNIFLQKDYNDESPKKSKPLSFLLKDLLWSAP